MMRPLLFGVREWCALKIGRTVLNALRSPAPMGHRPCMPSVFDQVGACLSPDGRKMRDLTTRRRSHGIEGRIVIDDSQQ